MQARSKRRFGLSAVPLLAVALLAAPSALAATTDLSIEMTDSPDPVEEGAVLTYEITVSNLGTETASGATMTDKLPSQVNHISTVESKGSCDVDGRTVRCDLGSLAAGAVETVTIKVRPTKTGQVSNTASVEIAEGDTESVAGNNTGTVNTKVIPADDGDGGPTCAGLAVTLPGTSGPDSLTGTSGRDVIKARGGHDVIRGLGDYDIVCAGSGNDTLRGGSGNDLLKGGSGKDTVRGGGGNDDLRGGPGRDKCRGGAGVDTERSC